MMYSVQVVTISSKRKTMLNRNMLACTIVVLSFSCQSSNAADPVSYGIIHCIPACGNPGSMPLYLFPTPILNGLNGTNDQLGHAVSHLLYVLSDADEQNEEWSAALKALATKASQDERSKILAERDKLEEIHSKGTRQRAPVMSTLVSDARQSPQGEPNAEQREHMDTVKKIIIVERLEREAVVRSRVDWLALAKQHKIRWPHRYVPLTVGFVGQLEGAGAVVGEYLAGYEGPSLVP
jgi:hypothetical protein